MSIKIDRHDQSMNENEKEDFRKSETWKNWRETVADSQNRLDFVTGEPLTDNWKQYSIFVPTNGTKDEKNRGDVLNNEKSIHIQKRTRQALLYS